jgi:hypothetical protein
MFTLRCGLLGSKALARTLGIWPFAVLLVWPVLIKLQEPGFFQREGVPFLWPSQQALILVVLALLPVTQRLAHGRDAAAWPDHLTRSPEALVLSSWLTVSIYGLIVLTVGSLGCYAVDSIAGGRVHPPLSPVVTTFLVCGGFLSAVAAITPVLAYVPGSAGWVLTGWLVVVMALLTRIGPPLLEFSPSPVASAGFSGMFSSLLATLGGLTLSAAHASQRLRT